jgi:glycosyltransferase involved in cell wall biosynthesis
VPAEFAADYGCFGTTSRLQVLSQTVNPSAYWQLRRVLADFSPHVLHVRMFLWQLSPLVLPLIRWYPSLYQTATYKSICPRGNKILPDRSPCHFKAGRACLASGCLTPQSWTFMMLQRGLWRRWRHAFGTIVALSENMKTRLVEEGIAPVEVIHNGVPVGPMRPPLCGPPTVAFAGRLVPEKGVDVLLHALALLKERLPDLRLIIAGDGPAREQILALAGVLGLKDRTLYLGYVERPALEEHFAKAWVQAVPSLWDEPFGNVATEAMMRGTAVVCSSAGGLAEIVSHGETGYLVPPGCPEPLARALQTLLSSRETAEKMGQAGRARALESFSEERCVQRFVALYERLISQYPSHRSCPLSISPSS